MDAQQVTPPVAIIGAGPVGLAAAAHLAERGIPFQIFEAGDQVGANLLEYGHVRLFSPWQYNVDAAASRLLESAGWTPPVPTVLPTAKEVVEHYLEPLSRLQAIAPHIALGARVTGITRSGFDKVRTPGREDAPFLVQVLREGEISEHHARAVLDASGTWNTPNPLGHHGLPVPGEREFASQIAYGMPDVAGAHRSRYAGRTVLVVGSGHSAAGNLLSLAALAETEPATRIVWAVRGNELRRLFGGGAKDGLPARGALGQQLQRLVADGRLKLHLGFRIARLERNEGGRLRVVPGDAAAGAIEGVQEIIVATGSRPDLQMTRELRVRNDCWLESTEALAPLIDPNEHSCGTVRPHGHRELSHPERGYYALGAKSYGRAPNFLMATGYEQARSVVAAVNGDMAAADNVQLMLPETGVCSTDFAGLTSEVNSSCCSTPKPQEAGVLVSDLLPAKSAGCGCGPKAKTIPARLAAVSLPGQECCG